MRADIRLAGSHNASPYCRRNCNSRRLWASQSWRVALLRLFSL